MPNTSQNFRNHCFPCHPRKVPQSSKQNAFVLTSYGKKLRTVLLLYNITDARAANIQAFSIVSGHTHSPITLIISDELKGRWEQNGKLLNY